ncbi:polysaccharide biosynthesis protein [Flavobacterium psychroterrae]|uniref:Polysaccharide biosynthesis protein n=1 Tax=Flavobacterium psychroterrae TaxID=2133767 RepID=A0ABS5PC90_9FLAO|nr:polysaccharide biosynthesis protein [Flavobacterium psychroterrae]MBS7231894.1 polysaccharide biosynthesis protein [Flavobacterium psychroterrae]
MRLFITGGAGYLGREIVKSFYDKAEITIYSRDEAKHYYLKKQFPKINCVIGDVSDFKLMNKAAKNHDHGIFAASLKQIEAVDQNVEVALRTIVNGAINSRNVAEENDFKAACFISSDKSRAATTLYGAMKFIGGESFIVDAEKSNVNLTTAIYGNVLNSTGSIIPLILDSIKNKYELKLYSPEMTRFMIDVEEAVGLIHNSFQFTGFNIIPNIPSFRVLDLFEIYKEEFGLKFSLGVPRISEKIHEIMIAKEETPRTYLDEKLNLYMMHYKNIYENSNVSFDEFSSHNVSVSKEELYKKLKENNFFSI